MELFVSSLASPFWILPVALVCFLIFHWRDRRDRNKLARLRAAYRTRTEKTAMPETPAPEVTPQPPAPDAIDLDSVTLGDLKRMLARATELNKPGKYVAILQSRRAQAAIAALIGIWAGFFTHSIDVQNAIQLSVAAAASWVVSDGVRKTE